MLGMIVKIAELIAERVDEEYSSPTAIKRELSELEEKLKNGLITEAEYEESEEKLLERLDNAMQ